MITDEKKQLLANWILYLSIGIYCFSLTQKCFCTSVNCGEAGEGAALLISGVFGWFSCSAWFAWLANPALLISLLALKKKPWRSVFASFFALCFSLYFLTVKETIINEAGGVSSIEEYELGYWLWVTSIFTMFSGNLALIFMKTKNNVDAIVPL